MTIKNSTRLLATVLTLAMLFSFVACDFFSNFSGSLKLESFIVDPNSYKAEYTVGEKVDLSGIQAIVKYNDESLNKTYTYAELTFSNFENITAEEGTYEITVSFTDPHLNVKQETKITIKVVEGAPVVTDPAVTEPAVTEPAVTEPAVTEPAVTEPAVTEPAVTEPTVTEPAVTEPTVTEPAVTEPAVTEPTVTEPAVTEPTVTEPAVTEPAVTEPAVTEPATPVETQRVTGFSEPAELVDFGYENKNAGTLSYGASGFSSQFAVGNKLYVIGNQNEFKLKPVCTIWNAQDRKNETLADFYATVIISVKNGETYVDLTKKATGNNVVEYYDGNVLMATVNTYKGTYQFTANAADKVVKISVAPAATHYMTNRAPVVLEAKIINAYNVYEAWQLAVIDNYNAAWTDFKTAHGIANLTVSGIVLHKDIHLSADDVPQSFFYTTTAPVVYKNSTTGAETVIPAGTKYLVDGTFIYERRGSGDFAIEGNFFTLDTKGFPLVPSPGVFGKDSGRDYGVDFSNAALFRFLVAEEETTEVKNIAINNISLIGNSARDNLIDSLESLASAGGLIFFKSSVGAITTMDNVIGNSYFITYFTEYKTTLNVTNAKCFDSYQNAAFIWGDSTFNLINSYVNGCGGPAIIAQSVWDENRHPIVNVTGTVLETHLSGQEIWFTAVNATTIVGQMQAIGSGLYANGLGNFVDANGKMNIMGALMAKGSSAADIVTGIGAQGSIFVDGKGIDRTQSAENINWMTIKAISEGALAMSGMMPPFFTVFGADGTAYTVYYNGAGFVDLAGNAFNPRGDATHAAIAGAFMQADKIILTQGGLSVVFEYYHY